jgi:hypothetical protein
LATGQVILSAWLVGRPVEELALKFDCEADGTSTAVGSFRGRVLAQNSFAPDRLADLMNCRTQALRHS